MSPSPAARPVAAAALLTAIALTPAGRAGDLAPPPGPVAPTDRTHLNAQAIGDLPYTISQPGSYVLTSDLAACHGCATPPADGITIDANNVTLDLNGFSIIGDPETAVDAITVSGGRSNIVIRNGIVRDFPAHAVNIAGAINSRVENLTVSGSGADGIRVGFGSTIRNCNVSNCLGHGIIVETACIVDGCTAVGCGDDGIHALAVATTNASVIRNCTVRLSTNDGIDAADGCTVSGCAVSLSGGAGILAAPGCTITDCSATINNDSGIVATDSLIRGNTALNNAAPQIDATSSTLIENHAP